MKLFFKNTTVLETSLLLILMIVLNICMVSSQMHNEHCDSFSDVFDFEVEGELEGKILPFEDIQTLHSLEEPALFKGESAFFIQYNHYASHFDEIPTPPPDVLFLS